jgi:hypothetical protein
MKVTRSSETSVHIRRYTPEDGDIQILRFVKLTIYFRINAWHVALDLSMESVLYSFLLAL